MPDDKGHKPPLTPLWNRVDARWSTSFTDRTAGGAVSAAANRKRQDTYPELAVARGC